MWPIEVNVTIWKKTVNKNEASGFEDALIKLIKFRISPQKENLRVSVIKRNFNNLAEYSIISIWVNSPMDDFGLGSVGLSADSEGSSKYASRTDPSAYDAYELICDIGIGSSLHLGVHHHN